MRLKSKTIVKSYNKDMNLNDNKFKDNLKLNIKLGNNSQEYKYMYDTLTVKSNFVLNRIKKIGDKISKSNNLDDVKLLEDRYGPPGIYMGRILLNSIDGVGKLNENSILFETINSEDKSEIIPIKLQNISSYSIYPGQVVCLKGVNRIKEIEVDQFYYVILF
jgi:DNA polymerase alpha subunit B